MKATKKYSLHTKILITITMVLLAAGVTTYTLYAYRESLWPFTKNTPGAVDGSGINYSPPTEQEVRDSQNAKKNNNTPPEGSANNNPNTHVDVGISFADVLDGKLEIRAFVTKVIEGSGTCKAELTRGGATITKESQAFIDTSSSICEPIYFERSALSSGTWDLVVYYSSPNANGSSDVMKVAIQ